MGESESERVSENEWRSESEWMRVHEWVRVRGDDRDDGGSWAAAGGAGGQGPTGRTGDPAQGTDPRLWTQGKIPGLRPSLQFHPCGSGQPSSGPPPAQPQPQPSPAGWIALAGAPCVSAGTTGLETSDAGQVAERGITPSGGLAVGMSKWDYCRGHRSQAGS